MSVVSNTARGHLFSVLVRRALEAHFGEPFDEEVPIPLGSPPRPHRFDLVSRSRTYVCECKAYTWTSGGNTPSAKLSHLKEAGQYLGLLGDGVHSLLILKRDVHPTRGESLAEYFVRLHGHLMGNVVVVELAQDGTSLKALRGNLPPRSPVAAAM